MKKMEAANKQREEKEEEDGLVGPRRCWRRIVSRQECDTFETGIGEISAKKVLVEGVVRQNEGGSLGE